jgi:propionyl-CoA synthetase
MVTDYEATYDRWRRNAKEFWIDTAQSISWYRKWDRSIDDSAAPFYKWFSGGVLNTCYNVLDIHVERGRGDQVALIYDSPVTSTVRSYTFEALREQVSRFAGVLRNEGVEKGDRVIIYMSMVPEAVITMLACARIGAIHSVVFGGFAAEELASRINDAQPKVIVSTSCGIEIDQIVPYKRILDSALNLARHQPKRCIILQRPQAPATLTERDTDWTTATNNATVVDCEPVAATDPLYILYTSGTTGFPKGVVRDNGGHLVALKWSMTNIYGMRPGEVFWAASDIGWAVGHSFLVYGPLLNGNATILYEGKPVSTPDPGAFWRVISQHSVDVLFAAPTAMRAIKREDHAGIYRRHYDLKRFRALFLAGERCDPDTLLWAENLLGVPVIDHWWQTETGWPIGSNFLGLGLFPTKPGSCGKPAPGYDVRILNDQGLELPQNEMGNVAIKLPLPPGCLTTLWNNDSAYVESYLYSYPGYYKTADAGYKDQDDYLWIMSRTDDVINVAGHRLSTGAMEQVLASHADVAECAVVGVTDNLKGEVPLGLIVLKRGVARSHEELLVELISLVSDRIGRFACFREALIVERLPKTRSGKIVRGTIKKMADGLPYNTPAALEEPAALVELERKLSDVGYPKSNLLGKETQTP